MAAAIKKPKIERDRFTNDGVRLCNLSKEHGVVYSDGFLEVKYIQEYEGREVHYRGDLTPVGYVLGEPLPKFADELEIENRELKDRIKDLEDSQRRTNELLAKLVAQKEADPKAPTAAPPGPAPAPTPEQLKRDAESREQSKGQEAPARGVKPK